jgi:hypothetical protein
MSVMGVVWSQCLKAFTTQSGAPIAALLAKDLEHDAHGNVQLSGSGALADLLCEEIKTKLKIKRVRGDTLGLHAALVHRLRV